MLPKIVRLNSGLSPRSRWSLALLGFALLALPTWYQEAQSRQVGPLPGTNPIDSKVSPPEGQPAVKSAVENKGQEVQPAGLPSIPSIGGVGPGIGGRATTAITTAVKRPKLPAIAPPTVEFFPEPSPFEQQMLTALEEKVDFDFNDATLDELAEVLGTKHHLQVLIDKVALEEEQIASDQADITRKLKGIPLGTALAITLEPKRLTFLVSDNLIKVTTRGAASEVKIARTYPVRDLVSNVDVDYLLLCRTIHNGVGGDETGEPWREIDGEGGSISILPGSGCLVVRHTARVQQGVLQLLRAIRAANAEAEIKVR